MDLRKCIKCNLEKNIDEFTFKIKSKGIRHKQCRECTRLLVKNHYNMNREYYLAKAKKRNLEIKNDVAKYLQNYFLNNPCVDCGETDFTVLDFDHDGKIPKIMAVSTLIKNGHPLAKIEEEIKKCSVRCANCHRRKTAKDFGWYRLKMHS